MKNKIVVAVIDSGVNKEDAILDGKNIEDYYYEDEEFKTGYIGSMNMHGTEVIKVLLKEAPDVRIISIRTLQENNKCMLSTVIHAVRYCIDLKVDVINLSLGSCSPMSKRVNEFKSICEEAVEKGIAVFAADNNTLGKKSYPANFYCVIGVTSSTCEDSYCTVEFYDKVINFSESLVYVPDSERCIIRKGNSYLCPMLVGLYCRFAGERQISKAVTMEFMEFLQEISKHENINKIFFNRFDQGDRDLLNGKKVMFFTDDMDLNNMRMYEMYKEVSDISLCFDDMYQMKMNTTELETYVSDTDIFFIGALSVGFIQECRQLLQEIIQMLLYKQIAVITVFPIIDTFQRITITSGQTQSVKSIYK